MQKYTGGNSCSSGAGGSFIPHSQRISAPVGPIIPLPPSVNPTALLRCILSYVFGTAILCLSITPAAAQYEAEREELAQRVFSKLEDYEANLNSVEFESATGLWTFGAKSYDIMHLAFGDVVASWGVDEDSRFLLGLGEGRYGEWRGYWSYACRGCCPGYTYWGPGVLQVSEDRTRARITVSGREIDSETCEIQADQGNQIEYDMERVQMLSFQEHLPGKFIHIVYNPVDGQYRASVKIKWDARFKAVRRVTVASRGNAIVQNSLQLTGEYEYLTSTPGKVTFLIYATDSSGQPLHVEAISIEIPRI